MASCLGAGVFLSLAREIKKACMQLTFQDGKAQEIWLISKT